MKMKRRYPVCWLLPLRSNAIIFLVVLIMLAVPWGTAAAQENDELSIVLAVEFNAHAACAHVARNKGWYKAEGIHLKSYDSYVTGMALAAGLLRGDVDAAYICLIPAINVYVNGNVPLKVVAGTHKYGYAIVVNPSVIKIPQDLQRPGIRIGCSREGSPTDAILHKAIETYVLDKQTVTANIQRMNPPKQLMALKTGQLDAAVVPEQYPSMAENLGFKVLLRAQDLWSDMQGSVLVVTDDLIQNHPDIVEKLVKVTRFSTDWINQHPKEASEIIASQLNNTGTTIFPEKAAKLNSQFTVTPEVMETSLIKGLKYSTDIWPSDVDETIAYMVNLGYIKNTFDSSRILDLRWLSQ